MFSNTWSWIIDKLNMIPGISIDAGSALPAAPAVGPDLLTGGTAQGVGRNGVLASGAVNGGQTTIDQRRTYGSTTIQVQQMPTPGQMREWQETQG